jgi:hypothetical protein
MTGTAIVIGAARGKAGFVSGQALFVAGARV